MWKAGRGERLKFVAELLVANEALVRRSALEKSCKSSGIMVDEKGFELGLLIASEEKSKLRLGITIT